MSGACRAMLSRKMPEVHANYFSLWRLDCALRSSFPKKVDQLSVHFLGVSPGYAVWLVLHHQ